MRTSDSVVAKLSLYRCAIGAQQKLLCDVPEVLNVYMNEIYKKISTIKLNKLKFQKSHFLSQKLIFHCLK